MVQSRAGRQNCHGRFEPDVRVRPHRQVGREAEGSEDRPGDHRPDHGGRGGHPEKHHPGEESRVAGGSDAPDGSAPRAAGPPGRARSVRLLPGGQAPGDRAGYRQAARDLAERIKAANEAKLVFGHSVTRQEDGRVLVRFQPEGKPPYRCPCLPKAAEPLPITYCYCCGGHVKHHLGIALGREMAVEVRLLGPFQRREGAVPLCTDLCRVRATERY